MAAPPWFCQVVVVEEKSEATAPVGGGDQLHDDLHHLLAGAEDQLTARRPVWAAEPGGEGDEVWDVEDVMGAGVKHRVLGFGARSWSIGGLRQGEGGLLRNAWVRTGARFSEVKGGSGVDRFVFW